MLLRVQRYNVTVKYVPGKQIPLADALSRINPCVPALSRDRTLLYMSYIRSLTPVPRELDKYEKRQRMTLCSPFSVTLLRLGGLRHETTVQKSFTGTGITAMSWESRTELSWKVPESSFRNPPSRRVGTTTLRTRRCGEMPFESQIVCLLGWYQQGHWKTVGTCAQCQTRQPSVTKEPLMPHNVPPPPWHTLCSDIFFRDQNHYLLIADLYSKYLLCGSLGRWVPDQWSIIWKESLTSMGYQSV